MVSEIKSLKPESRSGDSLASFAAITSILTLFGGTSYIVFTNDYQATGAFAYHPILQTLAIVLFTYGVLTLQPTSQPATKAAGLERHQLATLLLGLPVLALGTLAIMYKKYPWPHGIAVTWHGTFGYISILWLLVQICVGGASVWGGGIAFGGGNKAKSMWKYHRLSGYMLLPLLIGTAHLGGAHSFWFVKNSDWTVRTVIFTLAPLVTLASVYARVRTSKIKF
ncbi:hypothetical protein FIBSPDRAFT_951894 [Athelia psychrophila]|uniref:Cytochrome b561 domain-containing protein n=1 Tax=Athelia psychrophila TaxID=1759441 RepID=A0A166M642_9AGAM|nr:hypothetical protein FIBSPDRAFT_951894 [Fibularhizoctonia sp. CBS 109695]